MQDHNRSIYCKARFDLQGAIKRVHEENICETNKQLILQFINQHYSKGISEPRCIKILAIIRKICTLTDKQLNHFEKQDLIDLIFKIKTGLPYSDATKEDYQLILKQFFKWYEDEDDRLFSQDQSERRKIVSFYKFLRETKGKYCSKKIDPSEIITDLDCDELLNYCITVRERAFVRLIHESGPRIGEILCMKIRDVVFDNDCKARVHLDGKTGERRIPILFSVPFLRTLIACHPQKDNPNSLLWCNESTNYKESLKYNGARKMLKKIWDRIPASSPLKSKPCNPHFFRHSRATLLAPHLTSALLCKFMGWTQGSKQAKTYVHLCPDDLDAAYFAKFGIKDESKEVELIPKTCRICDTKNNPHAEYCMKCGNGLTGERILLDGLKSEKTLEQNISKMKELLQNPEFAKMLNVN